MTLRTFSLNPLRVGLISGLAVAGLLLSGCAGGEPQGSGTQSPSVSESPGTTTAPTPTPTAAYKPASATGKAENVPVPVLPDEAKKETKEGLEAFARYWYSALSFAYETGDTALVVAVSEPSCKFCTGLSDGVVAAWKDQRWIVGGQVRVPAVQATFDPNKKTQEVVLQVLQDQIEIRKADGGLYQDPTKASNSSTHAVAVFTGSGWRFANLGLIR